MRKLLGIAALIATGGTAAGAGALNLLGSDTLFDISTDVLTECPAAAGISYTGTGSGNGESAMIDTITGAAAGTAFGDGQKIAPMSRFMNSNVCAAGGPATQTATGMVIGLDGIVIGITAGAGNACNGTEPGTCAPVNGGMAYGTTVNGYTFTTWKDVLAMVFAGQSHETSAQIIANSGVNSGCGSATRAAIANTWGNIFQTACTSPDGCTQLQHAFRRDDASGTSDAFATLLGLGPAPVAESNFGFGTSPYCNANEAAPGATTDGVVANSWTAGTLPAGASLTDMQITTKIGHHLTTGQQVQIVGMGLDVFGNPIASGNVASNGVWTVSVLDALNFTLNGSAGTGTSGSNKVGSYSMVMLPAPAGLGASGTGLADYLPTNYRDFDPVRRPCANAGTPTQPLEDVCSRDNQLGLVLTVVPTDFLNNGTTAGQEIQFPGSTNGGANACTGTNLAVKAAVYVDPIQSAPGAIVNQQAQCPNGDTPHNGNQCTTPVNSGAASTACLNSASNKPSIVFNSHNTLASPSPLQTLGTVYNTRLMTTSKTFQVDGLGNPIIGAYYRIHQQDVIAGYGGGGTAGGNGAVGVPCVNKDATDQLGCLAQASPCSITYAGRGQLAWNGATGNGNLGLEVNQQFPDVLCITGGATVAPFTYPLSRKLYLDSIQGWGAASTAEQGMALCETSESGLSGAFGTFSNIITTTGFFDFTVSAPNNSQPFAEDYNEAMICPTTTGDSPASEVNTNTYAVPTLAGMPSAGTTCGNGIKEAYEDCDDGTPNATAAGWPAAAVPNGVTTDGNGGGSSHCTTTCRWTNAGYTGDPNGTVTGGTCSADPTAGTNAPNGTNCTTVSAATGAPVGSRGKCQSGACLPD